MIENKYNILYNLINKHRKVCNMVKRLIKLIMQIYYFGQHFDISYAVSRCIMAVAIRATMVFPISKLLCFFLPLLNFHNTAMRVLYLLAMLLPKLQIMKPISVANPATATVLAMLTIILALWSWPNPIYYYNNDNLFIDIAIIHIKVNMTQMQSLYCIKLLNYIILEFKM